MENIIDVLSVIDAAIGTERKRHIAGGMLISISMLFGGLAFTVLTIKFEEREEKEDGFH